jgi:hypothetical protein
VEPPNKVRGLTPKTLLEIEVFFCALKRSETPERSEWGKGGVTRTLRCTQGASQGQRLPRKRDREILPARHFSLEKHPICSKVLNK